MPRLIDADAFFNDFPEMRDYEDASQEYEADVETVRHGHNLIGGTLFECSECGYYNDDTTRGTTRNFNYCPNCGAEMDGGRKHDEE